MGVATHPLPPNFSNKLVGKTDILLGKLMGKLSWSVDRYLFVF